MQLNMTLKKVEPSESNRDGMPFDFEPDHTDISMILFEICSNLHHSGQVEFTVSGFGDASWPVDVEVDLSTIIDQVKEALCEIKEGRFDFEIDFYEQGVQRRITVEDAGKNAMLTCDCCTSWDADPRSINMNKNELKYIVESLFAKFGKLSEELTPDLYALKLFQEWKKV